MWQYKFGFWWRKNVENRYWRVPYRVHRLFMSKKEKIKPITIEDLAGTMVTIFMIGVIMKTVTSAFAHIDDPMVSGTGHLRYSGIAPDFIFTRLYGKLHRVPYPSAFVYDAIRRR